MPWRELANDYSIINALEKKAPNGFGLGSAAAKSNGVQFGRPRKPLPSNFEELYQRFRKNEPITRLAKECPEISESTLRLRL